MTQLDEDFLTVMRIHRANCGHLPIDSKIVALRIQAMCHARNLSRFNNIPAWIRELFRLVPPRIETTPKPNPDKLRQAYYRLKAGHPDLIVSSDWHPMIRLVASH